jgi:hypothetical protein
MILAPHQSKWVRAFAPTVTRLAARSTQNNNNFARWMSATAEETTATQPAFEYDFTMDDVVSLCKRRGIIFPSSEIYNGFAGFYDYGPLGVELKKNVKDAWWRFFVTQREDVVGLDSSIIHNPTTWKSSGAFVLCFYAYTVLIIGDGWISLFPIINFCASPSICIAQATWTDFPIPW